MNLGLPELLVILLFAFLIIGPERLPQLGKTIGKAIGQFRSAQDKVNDSLKNEGLDAESIRQASQNPFLALAKVGEIAEKTAGFGGENGTGDGDSVSAAASSDAGTTATAQEAASAAPSGVASASSGPAPDELREAPASAADCSSGAGTPDAPSVFSLSDRESFVERKLRLQSERASADASAVSPVPAAPSGGGGEAGA